MREIKFRVYEKEKDGSINVIEWEELIKLFKTFDELIDKTFDEKDEEWITTQYTGLKDKNGVEIYEGDILGLHRDYTPPADKRNTYVVFENGGFNHQISGKHNQIRLNEAIVQTFEKIGNIYERPDLLEVE